MARGGVEPPTFRFSVQSPLDRSSTTRHFTVSTVASWVLAAPREPQLLDSPLDNPGDLSKVIFTPIRDKVKWGKRVGSSKLRTEDGPRRAAQRRAHRQPLDVVLTEHPWLEIRTSTLRREPARLIKWLCQNDAVDSRRPRLRPSISLHIVLAARTCASIAGDSSTATTSWLRRASGSASCWCRSPDRECVLRG